MGINGKLLVFQVVNFLILLFVLRKLVYKPLLKFLDARRQKIEESLKKAENIDQEYQRLANIEKEEMAKAERKAVSLVEEAKKSAKEQEKEILASANEKIEKIAQERKTEISQLKIKILQEAKSEIAKYAILATQKILSRTFNQKDEEKLIGQALDALESHDKQ